MAEITVASTGGENEIIVRHGDILAIRVVHKHATLDLIHPGDLAHDHGGVLLFSQNSADWGADLGRVKHRRRYLIKKWLKQVMICPINENDLNRRFAKGLGRGQPAKSAADDHYAGGVRFMPVGTIGRIKVSIVHYSYFKLLSAEISVNLVVPSLTR